MIKYLYATKNIKSGNFGQARYEDFPKEAAVEVYNVAVKEARKEDQELFKELDLYYLGTFDTKEGKFEGEPEYLVSLVTLIGDQDGRKEA